MRRIYLDYAASAPLFPEAKQVIEDFLHDTPIGNPSSLHAEGRAAQGLLDTAHTTIAAIFGVQPTEVIFTSGATEANTLAIQGVIAAWRAQYPNQTPHIVMSAIEHPSWRAVANHSEADLTVVPVSRDGVVDPQAMLKAMRDNTALVGCMYVNNEIGTVQPIEAIGKGLQTFRQSSSSQWPVFHSDSVQAFPYFNTHIGHTRADMMTLSGHKYGALTGIGALIVKNGTPFQSVIRGGGQEWGHRAGTENLLGALTLAKVIEWGDSNSDAVTSHAQELQSLLESRLSRSLPKMTILAQHVLRAPHITYLWLPGVVDEHIVHKLDLLGAAVSSGSACSSGAMLPSATLRALGYSETEAFGGIRISFGRFTTPDEIERFIQLLQQAI